MLRYPDALKEELQKLILERIEALKNIVSSGFIGTLEQYKYETGNIRGLLIALELLDDAVAICDGKTT